MDAFDCFAIVVVEFLLQGSTQVLDVVHHLENNGRIITYCKVRITVGIPCVVSVQRRQCAVCEYSKGRAYMCRRD